MPQNFVIKGGIKIKGEVEISGSKNAAGPVIAATLLTDKECIIDNIPLVSDILNLLDILKEMGAEIEWLEEKKVKIKAGQNIDPEKMDFEKVSKSRVSVLLIGALLPRFKEFKMSKPGGDRIGLRPITTHLKAFQKLGGEVREDGDFYYFKSEHLKGTEIILPEFSVTATENIIMAAVFAEGKTIIKIAANEPHVQDLVIILNKMGARVEWRDTHTLEIQGIKELNGAEHKIISDPIESGTFMIIGAAIGEELKIKNVVVEHLDLFLLKLKEIGVDFKLENDSVIVRKRDNLNAVRLQALPYPGFPTDLLPLIVPLLTQADGKSLIHDPLYENRLNYTQELRKMGADIEIVDPHRAFILGKTLLQGVRIESWDIRAGASLVVAGLLAQGTTTIENIEQIDRGYEKIEEKLQKLGADIKRVNS